MKKYAKPLPYIAFIFGLITFITIFLAGLQWTNPITQDVTMYTGLSISFGSRYLIINDNNYSAFAFNIGTSIAYILPFFLSLCFFVLNQILKLKEGKKAVLMGILAVSFFASFILLILIPNTTMSYSVIFGTRGDNSVFANGALAYGSYIGFISSILGFITAAFATVFPIIDR